MGREDVQDGRLKGFWRDGCHFATCGERGGEGVRPLYRPYLTLTQPLRKSDRNGYWCGVLFCFDFWEFGTNVIQIVYKKKKHK